MPATRPDPTPTAVPAPVDTRDMVVVHTALLREIRMAPTAVVRTETRRQRARVVRHVRLLLDILDHHHEGEDRLLLPLLRARVPAAALDTGEEQHARIEELVAAVRVALDSWADRHTGLALVDDLAELYTLLEAHLRMEEREILPLAAAHLTAAEWAALGEAGFRAIPKPALPLLFGMMMAEGDPAVLRAMLAEAPPPARVLLPRIAPGIHTRHCRRLFGEVA